MIFISYSKIDSNEMLSISNDIKTLGLNIWFDEDLSGGQNWWDEILEKIRTSRSFIFILSPNSLSSIACKSEYEYEYATALGKPILPILVNKTVNLNTLPKALSEIQYIDYVNKDHTKILKFAKALCTIKALQKPLPDQLPKPPKIPITRLGTLSEKIDWIETLPTEDQSQLILDIHEYLKKPDTKTDALSLLEKFNRRKTSVLKISKLIESILNNPDNKKEYSNLVKLSKKNQAFNKKTTHSFHSILKYFKYILLSFFIYGSLALLKSILDKFYSETSIVLTPPKISFEINDYSIVISMFVFLITSTSIIVKIILNKKRKKVLQYTVDKFQEALFYKYNDDPIFYNQITLFKFKRCYFSSYWIKNIFKKYKNNSYSSCSGWLYPKIKSHSRPKSNIHHSIPRSSTEQSTSIIARSWVTQSSAFSLNLPLIKDTSNKKIKHEYAVKALTTIEHVDNMLNNGVHLPRSLAAMPLEYRGKIWGIMSIKSVHSNRFDRSCFESHPVAISLINEMLY